MDLPLIGTIDTSPTGIFLLVATLAALGYFGWQLFGSGRAGRDAGDDADSAAAAQSADGDAPSTEGDAASAEPGDRSERPGD